MSTSPPPLPRSLMNMFLRDPHPMLMYLGDDELWPRDEANRYRIYAVMPGTKRGEKPELEVLATSPTPGGVGQALIALHEQQREEGRRLADFGRIGVLDVMPDGQPSSQGEWVVLPFDRNYS